MKKYEIAKDIKRIRAFFNISQSEFAKSIASSRISIARYESGTTYPNLSTIEAIYSYAYTRKLHLNDAKASLYQDDAKENKLLFHGARNEIKGEVDIYHSIAPNDFGDGFYAGEGLNQAATWVSASYESSIYCFYFKNLSDLKCTSFTVGRKWMYAVLYYRGAFDGKKVPEEVMEVVKEVEESDYLIAPIADNQMYQILNRFSDGQITDEACLHALASTNLGLQYVFKTMKACSRLECIDRLYLCQAEKNDYENIKDSMKSASQSKAELSIVEYRRKGKYFDELFKGI